LKIGRYEIRDKLGSGNMGVVYQAWDPRINRIVALKVLDLQETDPEMREKKLKRFYREAETAGGLTHSNIVTIFDFRDEDGTPYIVMEYIEGQTLKSLLEKSPDLSIDAKLSLLHQICAALQYAHSKGVIHRDIKPGNIMVTPDGHVKMTDFSLAKISRLADSNITRTGQVMGTLYYMSPEHFCQEQISTRSDLFSLGVVMYEMFTGKIPFEAEGIGMIIHRILHEAHIPAATAKPGFDQELSRIIDKALAKDPAQRFASALELDQAVRERETRMLLAAARPSSPAIPSAPPSVSPEVAVGQPVAADARASAESIEGLEIIRGGSRMYEAQTYDEAAPPRPRRPSQPADTVDDALVDKRQPPRRGRSVGELGTAPTFGIKISRRRNAFSRLAAMISVVPRRVWILSAILILISSSSLLVLQHLQTRGQQITRHMTAANLGLSYGFPEFAKQELVQLPNSVKKKPPYLSLLAAVEAERGDWPGVLSATNPELLQQLDSTAHLARARALVQTGLLNEARELLSTVLVRFPDDGLIQAEFGRILRDAGDNVRAIHHLRLAAELLPNNPQPPWELARIYLAGGKDEVAEEQLIIALDCNPTMTDAAIELVAVYERSQRHGDAIALLQKILAWEPHRPDLRARLSHLLIQREQLDAAERQIQFIEILDPDYSGLIGLRTAISQATSLKKPKSRR